MLLECVSVCVCVCVCVKNNENLGFVFFSVFAIINMATKNILILMALHICVTISEGYISKLELLNQRIYAFVILIDIYILCPKVIIVLLV